MLIKLQNSISKSINTATGPDEIHYTLLNSWQYTPNISYNNIWISGNIPILWR